MNHNEFEESPNEYTESNRENTKSMNQGLHGEKVMDPRKAPHLSYEKVDSHTVFKIPKIPANNRLTNTISAGQPEEVLKTGGGPRRLSKDNSNDENNVVKKSDSKR